MAQSGLFAIGLPGGDAELDSYAAIARAEQAIVAATGELGLATGIGASRLGLVTGRLTFVLSVGMMVMFAAAMTHVPEWLISAYGGSVIVLAFIHSVVANRRDPALKAGLGLSEAVERKIGSPEASQASA